MTNTPIDIAVIGVPKSGTTSLYTWLAAHPDIQGSEPKETFYFIGFDGSHTQSPTFDDEGWPGFELFFPGERNGRLRLEATPSNVFSDVALRALTSLERSPLTIVAVRCPAEQIRSGFYFSQNNGAEGNHVDPDLTFPAYVQALLDTNPQPLQRGVSNDRLRWYLAESLRRGKYVDALDRWSAQLAPEAFMVVGFEQLTERPREVLAEICRRVGIDPTFYDNYAFTPMNRTLAKSPSHSPLRRFAMFLNRLVPAGRLHDSMARAYRRLWPGQFLGLAAGDETAAMMALGAYFAPHNQMLSERYAVDVTSWWPRAAR